MDEDIAEIERLLNQIEPLMQTRHSKFGSCPLDSKTVNELLERTRSLEHECKDESVKERLAIAQDMLAGYSLSFWLPGGWRNIIMLVIVLLAVLGGVLVNWYWWFLLLLATIFSPRLMGELMFFLGSLGGGSKSG